MSRQDSLVPKGHKTNVCTAESAHMQARRLSRMPAEQGRPAGIRPALPPTQTRRGS